MLTVMIDASGDIWSERESVDGGDAAARAGGLAPRGATLTTTMEALLTFMNAYLLLDERNTLSVLGWGVGHHCAVLWPRRARGGPAPQESTRSMEEVVMDSLRELQAEEGGGDESRADGSTGASQFGTALSRALCQHNRRISGGVAASSAPEGGGEAAAAAAAKSEGRPGRIFAVQVSEDHAAEYVQVMNGIFCAKKMGVVIDSCVLGRADSALLEQASSLTGGLNLRVGLEKQRHPVLLGTLLANFLPDPALRARALTDLHPSKTVSQKAVCFATHAPVDIARVCSVCLAVFERSAADAMTACASCGSTISRALA